MHCNVYIETVVESEVEMAIYAQHIKGLKCDWLAWVRLGSQCTLERTLMKPFVHCVYKLVSELQPFFYTGRGTAARMSPGASLLAAFLLLILTSNIFSS